MTENADDAIDQQQTAGPLLVGDIGGTNARFALARPGTPKPRLQRMQKLAGADFASLQQAARHYLAAVEARPSRAALAVASPVQGDEIRLTNRAWSFNREELRKALGLEQLLVLNDFAAAARAMPHLDESELQHLYGPRRAALAAPVTVLGPGTGMGVALLVQCPEHHWQAIETEGGHIGYAPQGSEERRIHEWLAARHGRVSIERVLSGIGLAGIHAALAGMEPVKMHTPDSALEDPAAIVAKALAGEDLLCRRALARMCAIFGSTAGDAALMHGARSLVIAGGILPRFVPFLRSSAFRERFLDKGRFAAWLEQVSIAIVTHCQPGLLGAALALAEEPA